MIITGKKFSKPKMSRVINGDDVLPEAPEKPATVRLDLRLVQEHPDFNRSTLQRFTRAGFVKVNGKFIKKPNFQVTATDQVELFVPQDFKHFPKPETLYEDDNVLVLNKPAGMLSMAKGEYCPETTLEDFGLLVHRLDRDTSGVVILAKNPETQKMLRKQFQDRKTHKTYVAIVEGRPKMDEALIDLPIARNLKRPNTFLVAPGGKESRTYYKILKSNDQYSLLELKPETGRTHQLRVHLKYLGCPIVGDSVYGRGGVPLRRYAEATAERKSASPVTTGASDSTPQRMLLHAHKLEITIPEGQRKTFTAPVPEEFAHVLQ